MIWNDPWIDVATSPPAAGEGVAPFCTTLPPPRPVELEGHNSLALRERPPKPTLAPDLRFDCCTAASITDTEIAAWRDLVGTQWSVAALRQRLGSAWIARLHKEGQLMSTCVLRRSAGPLWILETLVARPTGHGYATALVRSVMTWIWTIGQRGPFVLGYTWELSLAQVVWARWRGWLKSAATVEYGWMWRPEGKCQFCGTNTAGSYPVGDPELRVFEGPGYSVIVSDSGLGDGLGYVLSIERQRDKAVDWAAITRAGGWRALWWRGYAPPSPNAGWDWTGEIVVIGLLNYDGRGGVPTRWVTAEIAPSEIASATRS